MSIIILREDLQIVKWGAAKLFMGFKSFVLLCLVTIFLISFIICRYTFSTEIHTVYPFKLQHGAYVYML